MSSYSTAPTTWSTTLESRRRHDKWTAFVLSLAVPGAGQLLARSATCLVWFAVSAVVAALPALLDPGNSLAWRWITIPAWAFIALVSAEHAKRCFEPGRLDKRKSRILSRITRKCLCGSRVCLRLELDIPSSPGEVWSKVSDLPRFGCIDPFHSRITVLGPELRPGVDLALEHRAFGFALMRFGRLLYWHEGHGYAFSDISARGPRHGFPHVFFVTVRPTSPSEPERTRLVIDVRGKWTASWVPPLVRGWWLQYVFAEHARLLRATL